MCLSIVNEIINKALLSKEFEPIINSYTRNCVIDHNLIDNIINISHKLVHLTDWQNHSLVQHNNIANKIHFKKYDKANHLISCIILMLCKFASERHEYGSKKSETLKRKHHALNILMHLSQHSGSFFSATAGNILLLRRFILPTLIRALRVDYHPIIDAVLQIFIVLHEKFEEFIMIEQGIIFEEIFFPWLKSDHISFEYKRDIIDIINKILLKPKDVITFFYNYDNRADGWPLFERTIDVISEYVGDIKESTFIDIKKETINPEVKNFKIRCLKLLVHIMHNLLKWLNLPDNIYQLDDHKKGVSDEDMRRRKVERSNTWAFRFDQQRENQKVLNKTLLLAKTKSLKAALKYFKAMSPIASTSPREIAKFLFDHRNMLNQEEIGDILANLEDSLMTKDDYIQLRLSYVQFLDFTNLTFAKGLRSFLQDSGFRLPGEAQKIDRLLDAYCYAYCKDNPTVFKYPSAAITLAFAMIMLNTDHHNPNLRNIKNPKPKMTENQFMYNLRDCNNGGEFPRNILIEAYHNIANKPIEWLINFNKNDKNEKDLDY